MYLSIYVLFIVITIIDSLGFGVQKQEQPQGGSKSNREQRKQCVRQGLSVTMTRSPMRGPEMKS